MPLARLSAILFLIGLLTSRISLVLHELVGHALPALLVGSSRVTFELFLFAGGFVSFRRETAYEVGERLVITLGGIGVELVLAAAGLLVARKLANRPLARLAVLGFAALNLVHALFYLCAGAYHGYGDGWLLHRELGAARPWVVAALFAATVAAAFAVARMLAAELRRWLDGRSAGRQLGMILGAVALAGAGHAALTYGELELRKGQEQAATYSRITEHQSVRDAERELIEYLRELERRGVRLERTKVERKRKQLVEKHERFPLAIALAIAVALATIAGILVARPREDAPDEVPAWRAIGPLAAVTALWVGVIGLLRLVT